MHGQRGFTLLEALTTLVVASIIIGVGIPGMASLLAKHRLESAATELQSQLELVRSQAIKQNRAAWVSFASAADSWEYGLDDTAPCNPQASNDCSVHGVPKVFDNGAWKGVSLSQNFSGNSVGFEPRRGMSINPGSITLSSPAGNVKVNVSAIGRVTVCAVSGNIMASFPGCG